MSLCKFPASGVLVIDLELIDKMATAEGKDDVEEIVKYCLTIIKGEHRSND